jgi:glycine dehydrogenase
MYLKMMGSEGLKKATAVAVLSANYMAAQLADSYPLLYTAPNGRNAHEFIMDINKIKAKTGIAEKDIAKRLMDFGFHAPTMSWPAMGTLMCEPTESEPKAEMDRYIQALQAIRKEIQDVEDGLMPADNNPLVNAPHSLVKITQEEWDHPYTREQAAFPLPWIKGAKFWPNARINDEFGDRNLVCSCPPLEAYEDVEIKQAAPDARIKQKA